MAGFMQVTGVVGVAGEGRLREGKSRAMEANGFKVERGRELEGNCG